MNLVRLALGNPYLVVVMALTLTVLGITCVLDIPVDLLPRFQTPAVQIVTFYPGMPAEVMEQDITSRLERWTGQSNGIARQESKSMVGVSIVKDYFREDVDPNTAMSQVTSYAMSDLYYLPPGTIPPMVMPFDPTASLPLCLVAVSSEAMTEKELYDIAYFQLRNRLQGITGVIAPAVYGGKLRRILIYVERDKLAARGLSLLDVQKALEKFNVMIPTGNAKFGDTDFQIVANGLVEKVEELNDIPVKVVDGKMVFVRDVGQAKDSSQIQTNIVRINGRRQVYIPIYRQPGANTIKIVDGIREQLATILTRLPSGVNLDVVVDQSVYVRQSIWSLVQESLLGGGLAALMILLFLGSFRSTLIIGLSIPLSVMAAVVGLYFSHNTINAMTLGGLALALGRLVDDSIVVLENTQRHLAMGKTPRRAALEAAGETAMPVLAATITTVVVFFPVVFLYGMGRFLFTPLALTVAFAMFGSYLMAVTLVPICCARFLKTEGEHAEPGDAGESAAGHVAAPHPIPGGGGKLLAFTGAAAAAVLLDIAVNRTFDLLDVVIRPMSVHIASASIVVLFSAWLFSDWFDRAYEAVAGLYETVLRAAMRVPVFTLSLAVAALVGSFTLAPRIGRELFPEVDSGQLVVLVRAPSGTRIENTEQRVIEVERAVRELVPQAELKMLISNIGVLMDWPAAYTPNSGPMDAFLLVQLSDERTRTAGQYAALLRKRLNPRFPDLEFAYDTGGLVTAALNEGLPSPINIQVEGNKLEAAQQIAQEIKRRIETVAGTVDVRVKQRLDYPQLKVNIDRTRAADIHLTAEEPVKGIVSAFNSSINFKPSFWIDHNNGNHYFVGVQYREEDILSVETLLGIPSTSERQKDPALLRNIASVTRSTGPTEVNHRNITRVTDVFANVQGRDVGSVVADIEEALADLQIPPGYFVQMRGEVAGMRESFRSLGFGFGLSAVLVYLVLVAQFRSFLDPFIVMFAVPLGVIGVLLILWGTDTRFNVQSFMGVIFMIGIAVSNSILLVEFANRLRSKDTPADEAAVRAARIRLRPILMTSAAAVLGLLPMAVGLGRGSEANVPLARAVIGGLTVSTVLTVFVVPVLYRTLRSGARPQETTDE